MSEGLDDLEMNNWDTELVTTQSRNNLLIVDGMNLAFRWKPRGKDNLVTTFDYASKFCETINSLAKSYHAREIILLNDYKGSNYRLGIHPLYKSDRKKLRENDTEIEKETSSAFFEYYRDEVIPLAKKIFHLVQLKGVEADDVACYLVDAFEGGEDFDHTWLISTDGDWDELLSSTCSRFAYSSRKEFTIENFYERKDCDTPEQFTQIKAIMGDKGDSVYGVPGIGVKRAYNLIREHGDIFNLSDALPLPGKQLYIKALNESEELLVLNLQLVDLRGFCAEAIALGDGGQENIAQLDNLIEEIKNA